MRFMLDTNICIYIMKSRPPEVRHRLQGMVVGEVGVSSIVVAELWHGIHKSRRVRHNAAALEDFLEYCEVLDWPEAAAPIYGKIRSSLEAEGRIIGGNNLLIAAHAVHAGVTLVTNNNREFQRVPGLQVENWVNRPR